MDEAHIQDLLKHDDAVAELVASSIIIHDLNKHFGGTEQRWLRLCTRRDQVLTVRLEHKLKSILQSSPGLIEKGIRQVWPTSDAQGLFTPVSSSGGRWWSAKREGSSTLIHYNAFTGSLLVGGKPLSTLPSEYHEHELFRQVFSGALLDVVCSNLPNMDFMTTNDCQGHKLHLSLHGDDLNILSFYQGRTYAAIERKALTKDLPERIVHETVPWLCTETGEIELRDCESPWDTTVLRWLIVPVTGSTAAYSILSSQHYLLDNRSQVGRGICQVLAPIESQRFVHILREYLTDTITIQLPRYRLNFTLEDSGLLTCNELAATVAVDQSCRTLYGLRSKLIVQDAGSEDSNPKRRVLIPYGEVNLTRSAPHLIVTIDTAKVETVNYYQYQIDSTLGTLSSDETEGFLWQAYLHALTSTPQPDLLTGRTGTESSFTMLRDSFLKALVPFSQTSQEILQDIANLSPERSWYPNAQVRHLQQVIWNKDLSFLSQHDLFFEVVHSIATRNQEVSFLYTDVDFNLPLRSGNDSDLCLAKRAKWSWEKLYRTDFIAEARLPRADVAYTSRAVASANKIEASHCIGHMVANWQSAPRHGTIIYDMFKKGRGDVDFSLDFAPSTISELIKFDVARAWPSLISFLIGKSDRRSQLELVFTMSLMAFGRPEFLPDLKSLLSFATNSKVQAIGLPEENQYDVSSGHIINRKDIRGILSDHYQGDGDGSEVDDGEVDQATYIDKGSQYIVQRMTDAWSEGDFTVPRNDLTKLFDLRRARPLLKARFQTWVKNKALREHCGRWQTELTFPSNIFHGTKRIVIPPAKVMLSTSTPTQVVPTLLERLKLGFGSIVKKPELTFYDNSISQHFLSDAEQSTDYLEPYIDELERIVTTKMGAQDFDAEAYRRALYDSVSALRAKRTIAEPLHRLPNIAELEGALSRVTKHIDNFLGWFRYMVTPCGPGEQALRQAELWPSPTTSSLLQLLSRKIRAEVPFDLRRFLIGFAREVAARQRIQRLIRFMERGNYHAALNEVANPAHSFWDPWEESPDYLLFEIQNDILIRPVQFNVTKEMLKQENGVLQLQMGDGKSSVITPLFCALQDSSDALVRVVVIKSLAKETLKSLSKALSGFVQRPLYYMPFSRATAINASTAQQLGRLWTLCRCEGGVLLTQAEHLNSFRLIGNDLVASGQHQTGQALLAAQKELDNICTDLVDEVDEIFRTAFELVYAVGTTRQLAQTPVRYEVVLNVLDVMETCAARVFSRHPHGMQFKDRGPSTFAHIRILNDEAQHALVQMMLEKLIQGRSISFGHHSFDKTMQEAVTSFVTDITPDKKILVIVQPLIDDADSAVVLFMLRGLFACGNLMASMKKRFFVEFGLDLSRCLSAVPYRAKSVPSSAAEFAQSEVMITLTALSYYYQGLGLEDMRKALTMLLRLSDPAEEYGSWTLASGLPPSYRSISAINLQDEECVRTIYEVLHLNKATIKFFLRSIVYVKACREYPYKLSSSAWDLCAGTVNKTTRGFSGTTDSLMPTRMPKKDLADLKHFDAAILVTLLEERNRQYFRASNQHNQTLETPELLHFINEKAPNVSVIIDVGAQSLDLNKDIALMWLHSRPEKKAAVYFAESDNRMIVTRDGNAVAFRSSPFKDQMQVCLLYLDQHHSRGTDIALPDITSAAVLLGPRLKKDSLVQGCMRLRKLASKQQVIFFGSPEVDTDIRGLLSKTLQDTIDSADVIKWVIQQSCNALRGQQSLHAVRALEFHKRDRAFNEHVSMQGIVTKKAAYIDKIRTPEVNDVHEIYAVGRRTTAHASEFEGQEQQEPQVAEMLKKVAQLDLSHTVDISTSNEQEREQLHEVEQEREISRPIRMAPAGHDINEELLDIIKNNQLVQKMPSSLKSAFNLMKYTSLCKEPAMLQWPKILLATKDFLFTIENKKGMDDFLRPVRWLLLLKGFDGHIILLSEHEAHHYMPALRRCRVATLVPFSSQVSKQMTTFDGLDVYTVSARTEQNKLDPNALTLLRVFAGQLYFSSFEQYERFCVLLGIDCNDNARPVNSEKSDVSSMLKLPQTKNKARLNYVPMLKKWIEMRRKGIDWANTHIGRVLNGEALQPRDFA